MIHDHLGIASLVGKITPGHLREFPLAGFDEHEPAAAAEARP
jgi:hypothetical protein